MVLNFSVRTVYSQDIHIHTVYSSIIRAYCSENNCQICGHFTKELCISLCIIQILRVKISGDLYSPAPLIYNILDRFLSSLLVQSYEKDYRDFDDNALGCFVIFFVE